MLQTVIAFAKFEIVRFFCVILCRMFFIVLFLILSLNQNDLGFISFSDCFYMTVNIYFSALQHLFSYFILWASFP